MNDTRPVPREHNTKIPATVLSFSCLATPSPFGCKKHSIGIIVGEPLQRFYWPEKVIGWPEHA